MYLFLYIHLCLSIQKLSICIIYELFYRYIQLAVCIIYEILEPSSTVRKETA